MKMRRIIVFTLAALLTPALSGCARPALPEKPAHNGEWRGPGMPLSIDQVGTVACKRVRDGTRKPLDGPLKEYQGEAWKMKVDEVALTRAHE